MDVDEPDDVAGVAAGAGVVVEAGAAGADSLLSPDFALLVSPLPLDGGLSLSE